METAELGGTRRNRVTMVEEMMARVNTRIGNGVTVLVRSNYCDDSLWP